MHHNTGSTRHNPENLSLEGNRGNRAVKIPMFSEAKSAFRQMERLPAAPPATQGTQLGYEEIVSLGPAEHPKRFPLGFVEIFCQKK